MGNMTQLRYPADAIAGEGFTQSLNAAILAARGRDLRSDMTEALAGNDLAILDDTVAVANVICAHGRELYVNPDRYDLIGEAICAARQVGDFTPGDRFRAQQIAVQIIEAWGV